MSTWTQSEIKEMADVLHSLSHSDPGGPAGRWWVQNCFECATRLDRLAREGVGPESVSAVISEFEGRAPTPAAHDVFDRVARILAEGPAERWRQSLNLSQP